MMSGIIDGIGNNLRLIDGRHGLRLARQAALYPTELRCVYRRQLHHCHTNFALVMQQLATQRLIKPLYRMFRATISGLQWYASISERRADLNYHASITRQHALE